MANGSPSTSRSPREAPATEMFQLGVCFPKDRQDLRIGLRDEICCSRAQGRTTIYGGLESENVWSSSSYCASHSYGRGARTADFPGGSIQRNCFHGRHRARSPLINQNVPMALRESERQS